MKKILFLLVAACSTGNTKAQSTPSYLTDEQLSRWVIDINLLGGGVSQNFTTANSTANYLNGVNMNTGNLTYKNGNSFGSDAGIGFFFGEKRHWGVGTGLMYLQQQGFANLDNYHVEYEAYDGAGNVFRQVVNGNNLSENVTSTNINIPLVLKYKNRFSKHWGFNADMGALVNLQMNNAYTSNSNFNYEAIYDLTRSPEGTTSSYDNSPVPLASDWMITRAEFLRNNPNGNVQDYFATKRALGYSVGDGLTPSTRTGNVNYTQGSIGFIFQPSMNYFLSDHVALNLGLYYMAQPFKNKAQNHYTLTDGIGSYTSSLNNVTSSFNQSYGLNIGVRFLFGTKPPLAITSIDQIPPTECGLSDGGMTIHGLYPDQPVSVDYSLNGAKPTEFYGTVQPDGQVKIPNLGAGSYTGITARIKRRDAAGQTVTIKDPQISITSENISNPSLSGVSDGAVTFNGFYAGKLVTINYNLNGSAQAAYSGIVKPDHSIIISGLGEGVYTGIVATINTCTVNGTDFALAVPPPPPPAVVAKIDITTPVLFDFNKYIIHPGYYPELQEAADEMNADVTKTIIINGYTDNVGTYRYNVNLSVKRAKAVKNYLVGLGISSFRLKTFGHSYKSPVADNNTPAGRQENRRSVMKLKDGTVNMKFEATDK